MRTGTRPSTRRLPLRDDGARTAVMTGASAELNLDAVVAPFRGLDPGLCLSIESADGTPIVSTSLAAPDAVVYPTGTEEAAAIVGVCARHGAPIVPFGAGTSLEGHVSALQGGISIDMREMNRPSKVGPHSVLSPDGKVMPAPHAHRDDARCVT